MGNKWVLFEEKFLVIFYVAKGNEHKYTSVTEKGSGYKVWLRDG